MLSVTHALRSLPKRAGAGRAGLSRRASLQSSLGLQKVPRLHHPRLCGVLWAAEYLHNEMVATITVHPLRASDLVAATGDHRSCSAARPSAMPLLAMPLLDSSEDRGAPNEAAKAVASRSN
jgi:hypothetical protein